MTAGLQVLYVKGFGCKPQLNYILIPKVTNQNEDFGLNLSWEFACPQPMQRYRISKIKKQYEHKHNPKHIKTSKRQSAMHDWQELSENPRNSWSITIWKKQKTQYISPQYCLLLTNRQKNLTLVIDERKLASALSLNWLHLW